MVLNLSRRIVKVPQVMLHVLILKLKLFQLQLYGFLLKRGLKSLSIVSGSPIKLVAFLIVLS